VLTPSEWRVLALLRRGMTNAEMAAELGLSTETVKTHVSSMLTKTETVDRWALAAWQGEPAESQSTRPERSRRTSRTGYWRRRPPMPRATEVVMTTDIPGLKRLHSGKVRDVYELPGDRLLLVATDRASAFDVVLPTGVPRKGEVLTRLSAFWYEHMQDVVPNAFVAVLDAGNAAEFGVNDPAYFGRSMVMRRADALKVECVVRGYITGSGWSEYQKVGAVCGVALPKGLVKSQRLMEPIFTPTSKAEPPEHDAPMSYEEVVAALGEERANAVKVRSLALYRHDATVARERGILIADTKFEFGMLDGEVTLIDEVLTPDSSRFWPADRYVAGREQPSFDKQPLRDWLDGLDWDKQPPGPELPVDVVSAMTQRYTDAYRLLTGAELP
jgi:phosphoribosylaminoimidazole-succinocarboxamide synthase